MRNGISRGWLAIVVFGLVAASFPTLVASAQTSEQTWVGPTTLANLPKGGGSELWTAPAGPTGLVLMNYVSAEKVYQYRRKTIGVGWTPARTVATDAASPLENTAAVAADSTTARLVLPIGRQNSVLRYQVDDGTSITQSIVLGPGGAPTITIGLDGTAFIAARSGNGISLWQVSQGGVVSGPTTVVSDTATTQAVDPSIAIGPQGTVLLVWTNGQGCEEDEGVCVSNFGRTVSWSRYQGTSWSAPAALDTGGPIATVTGFAASHIEGVLTYAGRAPSEGTFALTYRNGTWGPAEMLGAEPGGGTVGVSPVGDAAVSNISATYTRTFGSSSWKREAPMPAVPRYCAKGSNPVGYLVRELYGFVAQATDDACVIQEYRLPAAGSVTLPTVPTSTSSTTTTPPSTTTTAPTTTTIPGSTTAPGKYTVRNIPIGLSAMGELDSSGLLLFTEVQRSGTSGNFEDTLYPAIVDLQSGSSKFITPVTGPELAHHHSVVGRNSFSADGKVATYVYRGPLPVGHTNGHELFVWTEGSGPRSLSSLDASNPSVNLPVVDAAGSKIAFVRGTSTGEEVFLADIRTGAVQQISRSNPGTKIAGLTMSDDGSTIAYGRESNRANRIVADATVIKLDTGIERTLPNVDGHYYTSFADIAADGSTVLLTRASQPVLVNTSTGTETILPSLGDFAQACCLDRDGRKVLVGSLLQLDPTDTDTLFDTYLYDTLTGAFVFVSDVGPDHAGSGCGPVAMTNDARTVVFRCGVGTLFVATLSSPTTTPVPPSGSPPMWVAPTPYDKTRFDLLPGKTERFSLSAVDADGDDLTIVTTFKTPSGSNRAKPDFLTCSPQLRRSGLVSQQCTVSPKVLALVVMKVQVTDFTGNRSESREFLVGGSQFKYIALGDSYSAGEGIDPYFRDGFGDDGQTGTVDNRCHRSTRAFAEYVKLPGDRNPIYVDASGNVDSGSGNVRTINKYGSDLNFRRSTTRAWGLFACSGGLVKEVLPTTLGGEAPAFSEGYREKGPQLDYEFIDYATDVVTITVGGNDALFADTLKDCAKSSCNTPEKRAALEKVIRGIQPGLVALYRAIKQKTFYARVIVLGYPRLFAESRGSVLLDQLCGGDLTEFSGEVDYLNDMSDLLNNTVSLAAGEAGAEFVSVTNEFRGHEVCTARPYLNGPSFTRKRLQDHESFHPNLQGQLAYARIVNRLLAKG